MTIQFRKRMGDLEWEVRSGPFQLWWTLYFMSGGRRLWVALFRELPMLDLFISAYEPKPDFQAMGGTNVYVRNAIAEFEADEISEDQFRETAQVYGALPEQIQLIVDQKNNLQGFHSDD